MVVVAVAVAVVVVVVVDPLPDPWWCPRSGRGEVELVGVAVARVPTVLEVDAFLSRAVGADTEPWSVEAVAVAAAVRAAYSRADAESAPTRDAAVGPALGLQCSNPPSTSSGEPLRLTGDGDPARTVTPEPLSRRPTPVINAATAASNQNASIGRAWFAFTVTLSRVAEPRRGSWSVSPVHAQG